MRDRALFARWFPARSWAAWAVFLHALYGLPMGPSDLAVYQRHTGRQTPPTTPAREGWLICGRRAGKSRVAALVAVYAACFRDYSAVLAPGEVGTLAIIAADRRQARTIMRYIVGFLDAVPMLKAMVTAQTRESITLSNRIVIEVHTASFKAVRGYTLVGVICDEIAFWWDGDAANPAAEILAGLRPGMATVPGALLLCLTSPYSRRGVVWQAYRQHFGQDGDVLVWQADTRAMNPTVDPAVIERAYEDDPAVAASEFGGEFRSDLEGFVSVDALTAATVPGRYEMPRESGRRYVAFIDPSGGSRDSMTLAIAHGDGERAVLDSVRERRPPFSPEAVVEEFAAVIASYGLHTATGDRYGGEWPRERFRAHGITYRLADQTRSELYLSLLPSINSRRVELLDHPRLRAQLAALERRTGRTGKDSIDHAPGAHDDVANAAAGALVMVGRGRQPGDYGITF